MLLNGFSQFTSLVLVVTVLFVCALDLTSARTINDRQITQNEAEIRLGFDGKDLGFERLRRPDNDAFEYQLKNLLLLSKGPNMLKPSHSNERNLSKRSTNRRFQLCGRQLHQMLTVVCSNRRGKRSTMETEGSIDDMFTSIYRPNSDLDYEPSLTFSNGYGYSNGSPLENYFETSYQELQDDDSRLKRSTRSGASTCCRRSCSLQQLRSYCPQSSG